MWKRFLLLFFVFGLSASCFGASVNWNASIVDAEHGAPDGYRVYYGYAADQLTTTYDVGAELNFTIPETWNQATYYFGVRAYNASGESGWATTPEGQTWVSYVKAEPPPVLPPEPATDVQIVWEQIEETPIVAYISAAQWTSGNITVPSGTTAAVVFTNAIAGAACYPTALSIGGVARSNEAHAGLGGYFTGSVSVVFSPSSGSQALSITWSETPYGEACVSVAFFDGTTSIRDIDADAYVSGDDAVTIDSNATDLVVGLSGNYNTGYLATPTGWTSVATHTNADDVFNRIVTCDSPGASTTTLDIGGTSYYCVAAVSLIASGGGSSAVKGGRGNLGIMRGMSRLMWLENDFLKPIGGQ